MIAGWKVRFTDEHGNPASTVFNSELRDLAYVQQYAVKVEGTISTLVELTDLPAEKKDASD